MAVPLLDLRAQLEPLRDDIIASVIDVIDSTRYVMGPKVEELEAEVAKYCGTKHAIGVSSGTDALLISLMALDIQPGDLVITTPYSFFATAGAISRVGAKPVFVDIDEKNFNIDPALLAEWFQNNADKISQVKAIIPVHLYGQCADMKPIVQLAKQHGVAIIEDAAQAIGSGYPCPEKESCACFSQDSDGQKPCKAGSMGDFGCFSFFPSKNLGGLGDGGIVTCSDDAIADKLRKLRNHGAKPKYYHSLIGGNFRLDPIQAAPLLVKLKHLESWHEKRRKNAEFYDRELANLPVTTPVTSWGRENHIYNQYVVVVPNRRNEFREFLKSKEIGNEVYYPVPFHTQECFQYLGYEEGSFPLSEHAATHTIAVPIYPELTEDQLREVVSAFEEFYG